MSFPIEPAIPLPFKIVEEETPVEKHVALAEHIVRRNAIRVFNNDTDTFRADIENLLLMVYNAGYEKGLITKQKIEDL